jgi:hypothetical protein
LGATKRYRRRLAPWCALAALALPLGANAQDLRAGTEFQVNTFTADAQARPAVAASPSGDFVVVWQSSGQDGSGYGIFGQRFARTGVPQVAELTVPVRVAGNQRHASVAAAANGDFVVAWQGDNPSGDGAQSGVFARRFTSAGNPLADEFQVNTYTTDQQFNPSVAREANGDFAVTWQSNTQDGSVHGIFARRFSNTGTALATEFQVNTHTSERQAYAVVAMDNDGDFVVVWQSYYQDGEADGIFGRRFSSSGAALAIEFQVATYTDMAQELATATMAADGDFVVAWQSPNDHYALNVFAQRFSSAGAALATEFQVNAFTPGRQYQPSVRTQANGDLVVAWQSQFQDTSNYGIFARRYSSAGVALDTEFQVNTHFTLDQYDPSLAVDANGDFVVAWVSGHDDSVAGVFAQRFGPPDFDVDGNGTTDPLTDGLLALRYLFGFRGATLITGAVGMGCTRCDAPAIEAYLAGITN